MRARSFAKAALGILLTAFGMSAFAKPVTLQVLFVEAGGTARAGGTVTVETSALANPGTTGFAALPNPAILDIHLTVTGATAGNGTYTTGNFSQFVFDTGGVTLDFSKPLVGQGGWGTAVGDFNFFGSTAGAPLGVAPFTLGANGGLANAMSLVAASPINMVPTLSEWAMVCLALLLAGVGIVAIRRMRG